MDPLHLKKKFSRGTVTYSCSKLVDEAFVLLSLCTFLTFFFPSCSQLVDEAYQRWLVEEEGVVDDITAVVVKFIHPHK